MLKEAIGHYRSVLDIAPDDRDARANIERAQTLIRQILEQPPQQQQQQSSDPNQSPQSQPQDQQNPSPSNQQQGSDPNNQPSDPNNQPTQSESAQDPNASNEPSQSKQQNQQDRQKQDQSRQRDANSPADPNAGAAGQDQRDANQPTGDLKSASEDPNQRRDPNRASPAATTQKAMSREEAERLLQLVRDRERQRREELARRQRAEPVPVEKDW
jgi:Ca-activated chloride channel family protein